MSLTDSKLKEWQNLVSSKMDMRILLIIMALAGVLLIFWPGTSSTTAGNQPQSAEISDNVDASNSLEQELNTALSSIDGAGRVTTRIIMASDGSRTYASNEQHEVRTTREKDKSGVVRDVTEETSNSELVMANNSPLVVETRAPEVKGVLVIAEGASNPEVAEKLSRAVTGLLDISAARVRVLPMETGR